MSSKPNQTIDRKVNSLSTQVKLVKKNKKTDQIDELECDKETALVLVKHGWKLKKEEEKNDDYLMIMFHTFEDVPRIGLVKYSELKQEWLSFAQEQRNFISFDCSLGDKLALKEFKDQQEIARIFLNTWYSVMCTSKNLANYKDEKEKKDGKKDENKEKSISCEYLDEYDVPPSVRIVKVIIISAP